MLCLSEPAATQNVEIVTRTNSSLTVTWDSPMSGAVSEYNINLEGVSGTEKSIYHNETRRVTFNDLRAGMKYVVVVVVISRDQ